MKLFFVIIVMLLSGCRYNRFDEPSVDKPVAPQANAKISELRYLAGTGAINSDMVVRGVVISSDSAGSIYKQLYVQDESGVVALQIGLFDMYVAYPVGMVVGVRLKGMACAYKENTLVVGYVAQGDEYPVGVETVNAPALVKRHLFATDERAVVKAREVSVEQIVPEIAGELVVVEGYFVNGGVGRYGGEQRFVDFLGGEIDVYTSSYAMFAGDLLPWGRVELKGIVTYYKDKAQLIISSTDDVKPKK